MNDKQPDYKFSIKAIDPKCPYENVYIGGAWTKENAKGQYFSCSFDEEKLKMAGYRIEKITDNPQNNTEPVK